MRAGSRGRGAFTLAVSLLALVLGACVAENNQIGLLRAPDGRVEVLYVRCLNYKEAVRTVRLSHDDSGETIWRIKDTRPISESIGEPRLQRFIVGESPEGFDEEVPLAKPLSESETYSLDIEGLNQEGFPWVQFNLDDLSDDRVYGPVEAPTQEFIESASEECKPPEPLFGGVFAGRWGSLLFWLVLLGIFGLLAFVIQRFKRRRVLRSPQDPAA